MKTLSEISLSRSKRRNSGIDSQSGCIESSWLSVRRHVSLSRLGRKQRFDMNKMDSKLRPSQSARHGGADRDSAEAAAS